MKTKTSNVNASTDNNDLGSLSPLSAFATPTPTQDDEEGSFPNPRERPYIASDL
jgi:hypothetical protein